MKLIDLYKEWMKTGIIRERKEPHGTGGLCNALPKKYLLDLHLFKPKNASGYWANNLKDRYLTTHQSIHSFNTLRQTIVLLICAMHDEL